MAIFGRVIEPDPTEGRGTPICSLLCMLLALLRGIKILSANVDGQSHGGFILFQHMIRTAEQGLARFTRLGGGLNGCAAVWRLWQSARSAVAERPHQVQMADAERRSELVQRDNRGIAPALLQAADVLLTEAGDLSKLLLCQPLLPPDPSHIPPDQLAHVHAPRSADNAP